jgi:hypothetical protein
MHIHAGRHADRYVATERRDVTLSRRYLKPNLDVSAVTAAGVSPAFRCGGVDPLP